MKHKHIYRSKYTRYLAVLLAGMMVLSGCGKSSGKVPELVEPTASNESYRPVQRGDVGNLEVMNGVVVPTDYCYFWDANTKVKEIKVNVGDYVEAGQVLAIADVEYVDDTIDSLSAERANYVSAKKNCEDVFEQNEKLWGYKIKGLKKVGDTKTLKQVKQEWKIMEENHKYDKMLYDYKISRIDKELSEQRKVKAESSLIARKSGYVTYAKDVVSGMSGSMGDGFGSIASFTVNESANVVMGSENVVVVSDYEDTYVELQNVPLSDDIFNLYDSCYTVIDGVKYDLKEYAYTKEEKLVASSRMMFPNTRVKFEKEDMMPGVGNNVAVIGKKDCVENTLYVGRDSLYQDSQGDFVYVKKGESREIRYVETGVWDDNNMQILEGLEEGELVYYSSESIAPENYVEYTVEHGQFVETYTTDKISNKDTVLKSVKSEYEGKLVDVCVDYNSEVAQGDLLCTIQVESGTGDLAALRAAIDKTKMQYESQKKQMEQQLKDLRKQRTALKKEKKQQDKKEDKQEATSQEAATQENTTQEATTQEATTQAEDTSSEIPKPVTEEPVNPEKQEEGKSKEQLSSQADAQEDIKTATPNLSEAQHNGEQPESPSPYLYEELGCQIEILKLNLEQAKRDYLYQSSVLQKQYSHLSLNNNGSGLISVYSPYDGVVSDIGSSMEPGKRIQVSDKICTIDHPSEPIVEVILEKEIGISQQVTVQTNDGETKYSGRVVGLAGDSIAKKVFLSTMDDKVYITNCVASGIGSRALVKMDDDKYYSEQSAGKTELEYAAMVLDNTITLPRGILYSEETVTGQDTYYYVWKVEEGQLVKNYVQFLGYTTDEEGRRVDCVLSGIKEGDVLARIPENEVIDDEEAEEDKE